MVWEALNTIPVPPNKTTEWFAGSVSGTFQSANQHARNRRNRHGPGHSAGGSKRLEPPPIVGCIAWLEFFRSFRIGIIVRIGIQEFTKAIQGCIRIAFNIALGGYSDPLMIPRLALEA
jgi:hypothetical protein